MRTNHIQIVLNDEEFRLYEKIRLISGKSKSEFGRIILTDFIIGFVKYPGNWKPENETKKEANDDKKEA